MRGTEGISGWTGGEERYCGVGKLGIEYYCLKMFDWVIGLLTRVNEGKWVPVCGKWIRSWWALWTGL